jgi:hypothetical protein
LDSNVYDSSGNLIRFYEIDNDEYTQTKGILIEYEYINSIQSKKSAFEIHRTDSGIFKTNTKPLNIDSTVFYQDSQKTFSINSNSGIDKILIEFKEQDSVVRRIILQWYYTRYDTIVNNAYTYNICGKILEIRQDHKFRDQDVHTQKFYYDNQCRLKTRIWISDYQVERKTWYYDPFVVGDRELDHNFEITIYPNPSTDSVHFYSSKFISGFDCDLYNLNGKLILSRHFPEYSDKWALPVLNLNPGFYLYRLNSFHESKTGKFIKE